jgi:low-affinity inorganic phosphate transporter
MSKKSIFHFARCAFVLDNAPRSCPQNGVTSYATFVCRPGFTYRAFILLALVFVLFYEAINGFHDTANAVATVIYTRAMRSQLAVVMAAVFNFLVSSWAD